MSENKTKPTGEDVTAFLNAVQPVRRSSDGLRLERIFREATGFAPELWTGGIVGFGRYDYTYKSGRTGSFLATGFAPRKANLVVYIMPGYSDFGDILADLGKYKLGRSCLYLNKLADVDEGVLKRLIQAGLKDLGNHWPVQPT
jgi:hypothetical protein